MWLFGWGLAHPPLCTCLGCHPLHVCVCFILCGVLQWYPRRQSLPNRPPSYLTLLLSTATVTSLPCTNTVVESHLLGGLMRLLPGRASSRVLARLRAGVHVACCLSACVMFCLCCILLAPLYAGAAFLCGSDWEQLPQGV